MFVKYNSHIEKKEAQKQKRLSEWIETLNEYSEDKKEKIKKEVEINKK